MRELSYLIVFLGLLLLGWAGYESYRGVTTEPTVTFDGSPTGESKRLTRKDDPERFHNAMKYHYLYGGMIVLAGVILHAIVKGQDRTDPLSTDLDWKDDEKP
jgi:hypothetical protein